MLRHGWLIRFAFLFFSLPAFAQDIAPGGTLRAAYLANNPAQAVRDPASGEIRGASADPARELAQRNNIPLVLMPLTNPPAVIEAVAKGDADIGFVAYAPERVGTVEFSQIYMLVQQSFIVPDGSPIRAIADIDIAGRRIAGGKNDSVTLYLARNLKQATLVETDNTPTDARRRLLAAGGARRGTNHAPLYNLYEALPSLPPPAGNSVRRAEAFFCARGEPRGPRGHNFFYRGPPPRRLLQNRPQKRGGGSPGGAPRR